MSGLIINLSPFKAIDYCNGLGCLSNAHVTRSFLSVLSNIFLSVLSYSCTDLKAIVLLDRLFQAVEAEAIAANTCGRLMKLSSVIQDKEVSLLQ